MSRYPKLPLSGVLEISKERIEPTEHPERQFNFVGLEHIEGHTGALFNNQPTAGAEIRSTKNVFHEDEVLFGKLRPNLNKVHLAAGDGICSTDIYVLRPRTDKITPGWAAYFLRSPRTLTYVTNAMAGANLPRISQQALMALSIPIPPFAEQERIVRLLDEADAIRKLRARADQRTADLIPALFHEMFGDPITNPMGWETAQLPEVCVNDGGIKAGPFGSSLTKAMYTEAGPRVYGQEQVISGDFTVGEYHISEAKFREMSPYAVVPEDVLISLVGTIGKLAIVPATVEPGIINPRLVRIRPDHAKLNPSFLIGVLRSPSFVRHLGRLANGGTMGVLNATILKRLDIPVPPIELQGRFEMRVAEFKALQDDQSASGLVCDGAMSALLHKSFNTNEVV